MGVDTVDQDAVALAAEHDLFDKLWLRNGSPPLWRREATFATIVRLILEQQVSLASANAAYARLETRVGSVDPESLLASSDADLREDGFSRQKAGYVRGVADSILSGNLDLVDIAQDGEQGGARLREVKGIGPWTAACFLLFVSGERDVWPTGDRALYVSMKNNLGLDAVPPKEVCDDMASAWAPRRSTAARMLWYDYLGGRAYEPDPRAGFIDSAGRVLP
ncbi:MAG: DNA-3-methyladenine glycosylase family protein [Acidimicrobiia bacterium]